MYNDFKRISKGIIKPLLSLPQNLHRAISETAWIIRRGSQIDQYYKTPGYKKLNIGCGANRLKGWLNADFSPEAPDVIFLDATESYPLKDGSFDYVFSEHMIEHVPYDHGLQMLRECYRILKPGGRLRIDTPDLSKLINLFADEKSTEQIAYINWFVGKFAHSEEFRVFHECFVLNRMVREWGHQFIYDAWTLSDAMSKVGFRNCTQFSVGLSDDPELIAIEGHSDISGTAINAYETLVVEAEK